MTTTSSPQVKSKKWNSPVPEQRWKGFRALHPGVHAFASPTKFEQAQLSELYESLSLPQRQTLARLLERGQKAELEMFLRTHGANPLFDPEAVVDIHVGMVKADHVKCEDPASAQANHAILNGDVVHVLFQAGEASRFNQGPFFNFNPLTFARHVHDQPAIKALLTDIEYKSTVLSPVVKKFLLDATLGEKQPVMLRAGLRRVIQEEIHAGRISVQKAPRVYKEALHQQKLLFLLSRQNAIPSLHEHHLREQYAYFGFHPQNMATVEQDLIHGMTVNADGDVSLIDDSWSLDAAGHLYVMFQSARSGDFSTSNEQGRLLKRTDIDALGYLAARGGKYLNIIRINDMDRHTTEILNGKALSYALKQFELGYANVIECVSNPSGQKGGTGLVFGNIEAHFLTETHENSFPALSRKVEVAMQEYHQQNAGLHPAYNAMRQWALLDQTRDVLQSSAGRLVFVPRQKTVHGQTLSYIGVDMPMGDLSLLAHSYPSRMFQFSRYDGRELHIHDMKTRENLDIALRTILHQLTDVHILNAVQEVLTHQIVAFSDHVVSMSPYAAPAPEIQ